jgi:hypothetical protein
MGDRGRGKIAKIILLCRNTPTKMASNPFKRANPS